MIASIFFQRLLRLEIHFLETRYSFAQIHHIEQRRMAIRQFARD